MSKILKLDQEKLNELDRKLHEMAVNNFALFCELAGINKTQAYVCFEFSKGKSYGQIGIQLKINKSTIYAIAKKCPEFASKNIKQ